MGSLVTLVNHHVVDKAQAADPMAHVCVHKGEEGHFDVLVHDLELGHQDWEGELKDVGLLDLRDVLELTWEGGHWPARSVRNRGS